MINDLDYKVVGYVALYIEKIGWPFKIKFIRILKKLFSGANDTPICTYLK